MTESTDKVVMDSPTDSTNTKESEPGGGGGPSTKQKHVSYGTAATQPPALEGADKASNSLPKIAFTIGSTEERAEVASDNALPPQAFEHGALPAQASEHDALPPQAFKHGALPAQASEHDALLPQASEHDTILLQASEHDGVVIPLIINTPTVGDVSIDEYSLEFTELGPLIYDDDMDSDDLTNDVDGWEHRCDAEDDRNRPRPEQVARQGTGGCAPRFSDANDQAVDQLIPAQVATLMAIFPDVEDRINTDQNMKMVVKYLRDPKPRDYEVNNQNLQILWRYSKRLSKDRIQTADGKRLHLYAEALMDVDQKNREAVMADPHGQKLYATLIDSLGKDIETAKANLASMWGYMKRLSYKRTTDAIWGRRAEEFRAFHASHAQQWGPPASRGDFPASLPQYVRQQAEDRSESMPF